MKPTIHTQSRISVTISRIHSLSLLGLLSILLHIVPSISGPTEIPDTLIHLNNKILHFFAPAICIGNSCTCPLTSGMELVFTGSYLNHEFWACKVKR